MDFVVHLKEVEGRRGASTIHPAKKMEDGTDTGPDAHNAQYRKYKRAKDRVDGTEMMPSTLDPSE